MALANEAQQQPGHSAAAAPSQAQSSSSRKRRREDDEEEGSAAEAPRAAPSNGIVEEQEEELHKHAKTAHDADAALAKERMTLFVWNLQFGVTQEDLQQAFEAKGCTVAHVRIVKDRNTGRSKGFAYVEMTDVASVSKGLQLDNVKLKGRLMRVSISNPPKSKEDKERQHAESERERQQRKDQTKPAPVPTAAAAAAAPQETVPLEQQPTVRKPKNLMMPRSVMIKAKTQAPGMAQAPAASSTAATSDVDGQQTQPLSNTDFRAFLLKK